MEFGLKTTDVSLTRVLAKHNGGNGYIVSVDAYGHLLVTITDGVDTVTVRSLGPVNDDKWHHFIINIDRDSQYGLTIYKDGELSGTTAGDVRLLGAVHGNGQPFNSVGVAGKIYYLSAVGVYSKVLSTSEIATRSGGGRIGSKFIGTEAGLNNAWNLDEGTGTTSYSVLSGTDAELFNITWEDGEGLPVDKQVLKKIGKISCDQGGHYEFVPPIKIGRNNPIRVDETDGGFTLILSGGHEGHAFDS